VSNFSDYVKKDIENICIWLQWVSKVVRPQCGLYEWIKDLWTLEESYRLVLGEKRKKGMSFEELMSFESIVDFYKENDKFIEFNSFHYVQ